MRENIKHVSESTFDSDVLQSELPVLVDFWAQWCGPCKMIAPILEEIAQEFAGRVVVAKVDVDANKAIAEKFGIRGIPALVVFRSGSVVAQKVGALGKGQLTQFVSAHL